MSNDPSYRDLLKVPPAGFFNTQEKGVSESSSPYHFFRERHLQAMWLEQKYFRQLYTIEGLPITILSPGIWNGEAGPDFLKAHLMIGSQEFRGDVELHLYEEDWYRHQHHQDEKYNDVILHVGFWKPKNPKPILTLEGTTIPCTHLENQLTIPESRILKLIDLDLYPYKHFVGSGICAKTLFRTLPDQKIIHFFRKAADWRLEQKRRFLEVKIDAPSEYLAGGIAMALGYKHNAEAFLELFLYLKNQEIRNEVDHLALALGICGFFAEKHRLKWTASSKYRDLASRFDAMPQRESLPKIILKLDRTRPANNPIRRIAILTKLISDTSLSSLADLLEASWQAHWPGSGKAGWKPFRDNLSNILPNYPDAYWETHYAFEEQAQVKPIVLISSDLKREILINVCLPLLQKFIEERNNPLEKEAFQDFYASFPAAKTKKASYLVHRFFGDTQKGRLMQRAEMQQGAYQLHRDFCIHFEASCLGCPFVERYNVAFAKN